MASPHLGILLVRPVLQTQLQERVVDTLWRVRLHFTHVLQEGLELSWVIGKDGDELLRVGLKRDGGGQVGERGQATQKMIPHLPDVVFPWAHSP